MPHVEGRIDNMAVDLAHKRLCAESRNLSCRELDLLFGEGEMQLTVILRPLYYAPMSERNISWEIEQHTSEIKFIVSGDMADQIRTWAGGILSPDSDGGNHNGDGFRTETLYFDTPDLLVYHRCGSYKRGKYRIRRYEHSGNVFLERKLRRQNMVCTRRTAVPLEDLAYLGKTSVNADWPGWWFHKRLLLRKLSAVRRVHYRRIALVGSTDEGPIRLTLDDELKALAVDKFAFGPVDGILPLSVGTIVEITFPGAVPAVFKRLVEEFALKPVRISKFRLAIESVPPAESLGAATLE